MQVPEKLSVIEEQNRIILETMDSKGDLEALRQELKGEIKALDERLTGEIKTLAVEQRLTRDFIKSNPGYLLELPLLSWPFSFGMLFLNERSQPWALSADLSKILYLFPRSDTGRAATIIQGYIILILGPDNRYASTLFHSIKYISNDS